MPSASSCRGSTGLEWKSRLAPVVCKLGRAHTGDSLWDLEGEQEGFLGKWFDNWQRCGSIEVRALRNVNLVQNPCYHDSCPVPGHHCVEVQMGDLGMVGVNCQTQKLVVSD